MRAARQPTSWPRGRPNPRCRCPRSSSRAEPAGRRRNRGRSPRSRSQIERYLFGNAVGATGTRARFLVWAWKMGNSSLPARRSFRAGLAQSLSQGRNSPESQSDPHRSPCCSTGLSCGNHACRGERERRWSGCVEGMGRGGGRGGGVTDTCRKCFLKRSRASVGRRISAAVTKNLDLSTTRVPPSVAVEPLLPLSLGGCF